MDKPLQFPKIQAEVAWSTGLGRGFLDRWFSSMPPPEFQVICAAAQRWQLANPNEVLLPVEVDFIHDMVKLAGDRVRMQNEIEKFKKSIRMEIDKLMALAGWEDLDDDDPVLKSARAIQAAVEVAEEIDDGQGGQVDTE